LYPSTEVDLEALRGRDVVTDEILELTGREPETIWIFEDLFNTTYELDLYGRVRKTIQASKADAQATQAARDAAQILVAAETVRAYADICSLGEELAVARRSVDTVSREATITRNRTEAGAGSRFDVVRAENLVAQAESAVPPLEGRRSAALYELTALLG